MPTRLLAKLANALANTINLRLVRQRTVDELTWNLAKSHRQIDELNQQLGQLRNELSALSQRYDIVVDERDRQLAKLQARFDRILNSPTPHQRAETDAARLNTITIIVTTTSQIDQLALLLGALRQASIYRPVVVSYVSANSAALLDLCKSRDVDLLDHEVNPIHVAINEDGNPEWLGTNIAFGKLNYGNRYSTWVELAFDRNIDFEKIRHEVDFQNRLRNEFIRFLRHSGTNLVLLFEDNAETETGIWVAAARTLGIPSAIIPFTIADEREPAEAHKSDPLFDADSNEYNRLASKLLPHWTLRYKGKHLLRRPGISAIVAEWLGHAPPLPWILNSTMSDAIAVESQAMRNHYLRLGVPDSKLKFTGSLSDDVLFSAKGSFDLENEFMKRESSERILLCAFPPNQLSAGRPECEFDDYISLVDFWMSELRRLRGWRVIVRPHPFIPEPDVERLRSYGFTVTTTRTAALIPHCDLYLASVSATIRWALAMGKPVLNYDVFVYGYTDFSTAQSVIQVATKEEFSSALRRYDVDRELLRRQTAMAQAESHWWGEIDGDATRRILRLIDKLTSGETPDDLDESAAAEWNTERRTPS